MNRRSFLQVTLASAAALVGYSVIANAEERRRGGGSPGATPSAAAAGLSALVDPNDPAAKAVTYVHVNTQVKDKNLQTERTGVKFKDQKCKSCAFYVKDKEAKVNGKTAAPCQMPFATGKAVAAEGWCTSWAKRA
ncbi:MAG: putative high potential iron-sulfur protein (HiPIP) [Pseudobdellovibrio sp.]|jgi:hypothetical protein|nr:putative high potential iron-sulfur protein (HiPIP) [Pseudobdellovibrio sp.]